MLLLIVSGEAINRSVAFIGSGFLGSAFWGFLSDGPEGFVWSLGLIWSAYVGRCMYISGLYLSIEISTSSFEYLNFQSSVRHRVPI